MERLQSSMGLVDSDKTNLEPKVDVNIVLEMDVVIMKKTCRRREWNLEVCLTWDEMCGPDPRILNIHFASWQSPFHRGIWKRRTDDSILAVLRQVPLFADLKVACNKSILMLLQLFLIHNFSHTSSACILDIIPSPKTSPAFIRRSSCYSESSSLDLARSWRTALRQN